MNLKRSDPVRGYREYALFQLFMDGEGSGLRPAREALDPQTTLFQEVRTLDAVVREDESIQSCWMTTG